MNKIKSMCIAIILTFLTMLLTGYSYSVALIKNNQNTDTALANTNNLLGSYIKAEYVFKNEKKGKYTPVSIYAGKKELLRITDAAGGLSPEQRAKIITANINNAVNSGENLENILPGSKNGLNIIKINNKTLFTIDSKIAKEYKMNHAELAVLLTDKIRNSFGASEIPGNFKPAIPKVKKPSKRFIEKYTGFIQTGIASWYGGFFHGRTAADGSIYDKNKFTAAHKSLPFGTVVKVTNLRNGKECIVRITDRGPFIKDRIIDLSKIAATEIGMLSSGISKVKIEIIGKA